MVNGQLAEVKRAGYSKMGRRTNVWEYQRVETTMSLVLPVLQFWLLHLVFQ